MATPAASELPRLRRSKCLTAFWDDDQFILENYVTGGRLVCLPILAQFIHSFAEFTDRSRATQAIENAAAISGIVAQLVKASILIEEGSDLADKEDQICQWSWGHDARCFHFSTQQVAYSFDFDAIREQFERRALVDPPPSPFKEYLGDQVQLPPGDGPENQSPALWDVLERRRTVRTFRREAISIEVLASILFRVWGKVRYYNSSKLDARIIKTSPSGGARHPIEVYVVAQRVNDLVPGVYHYSVQNHSLISIAPELSEDRIVELFSGQTWVRDAAVQFFMTAVLPRSMWKYDHSRAYRVVQLDAGHLGQTFHLVCTALGLGPFTTAALQDRDIESTLGIDGIWETVIYGAATGFAAP